MKEEVGVEGKRRMRNKGEWIIIEEWERVREGKGC
jgi:hypothetical protein